MFEHDDQKVPKIIREQILAPLANLPVLVLRKSVKCGLVAKKHATNVPSTECKVSVSYYRGGV